MMRSRMAVASLIPLLSVGILDGQPKPVEQISGTEIESLAKQRKLEVLQELPGVFVHAFWKSPAPSEENDRLQVAIELRLRNHGITLLDAKEYNNTPVRELL